MSDITPNTALASLLESRLIEWERASEPQRIKMLDCYMDAMRIARDNDTKGTGQARAKKTTGIFIGSTRNKIRATRAKLNDALFGNGKMPFDTSPVDESLAKFADVMEDILSEQMERMDLRALLKDGVDTLATYGTGFLFGPFVRKEQHVETMADNSSGVPSIKESKYEYDCPYYLLGNTLDCYPDPEARNIGDGLGVFWVTMESPHTVAAWKQDKSYSNVEGAMLNAGERGTETGSQRATQLRANVEYWHKNDRIKVARFFGKVPKSMLTSHHASEDSADAIPPMELVDAVIVMAGGVVVKANESPYGADCDPALVCQYEKVPHELWGVGVADNNSPHQKVVNAAFRLFLEGKGMALLGTRSVDRSKFLPSEDFQKFPGKVYSTKPNLSPDEMKTAIIHHDEPDVSSGWREVIEVSEQFSDDDTALTKYTQGDDSRNLNKTATGISMIMSAGSLPSKEVLQNIDGQWIVKIVKGLIDWNLKYLEVETVAKLHGQEHAQIWQQIKTFGKSSFMEWKATGTSSFMAKEVLLNKLKGYLEMCLSSPELAAKVDVTELMEQYWDCMEMGKESPILKDDGEDKIPEPVKQKMQQTEQHAQEMEKALHDLGDKYNELHSKAEADAESRRIEVYRAHTDRIKAIIPFVTPELAAQLLREVGLDVDSEDIASNAPVAIEQQQTQQAQDDAAVQAQQAHEAQQQEMPAEKDEPQPESAEPAGQPEQ